MLLSQSKTDAASEACLEQVERLVQSPVFEGSESLCRLIRFLAEHSLHSPSEHLKEYQIATEALGRPSGFDPHSDSSVRVQMGRLREKIADYYGSQGISDPIVIELPKGSYTLQFFERDLPAPQTGAEYKAPAPQSTRTGSPSKRRIWIAASGVLAAILAIAGITFALYREKGADLSKTVVSKAAPTLTPLEVFWRPFLHGPDQPFVVFRNSIFVGNDAKGLRLFDPLRDNPNQEIQGFTGVGEVMGMLELTQLFDSFGSHFHAKRGNLFAIDDARRSNIIFVGFPGASPIISQIPGTTEFTIRSEEVNGRHLRWMILDHHPPAGTVGMYHEASLVAPISTDYAIVALKRGLDPSHWTLFLEGTSTIGTEAAVDYVCNESTVAGLLEKMHVGGDAQLKSFEGLLRVRMANAVPVETELLDLRMTNN